MASKKINSAVTQPQDKKRKDSLRPESETKPLYNAKQACLEYSTQSREAWLESLRRGCLNNDCGYAVRRYSHIKALSSRKLDPLPCAVLPHKRSLYISVDESTGEPDESERPLSGTSKGPPLSPVIIEDLTRPPDAILDTSPLLLTTDEFFNYIVSEEWPKEITLRVVGGELLSLILCALIVLESRYYVNSHLASTYFNNRQWVGPRVNHNHLATEEGTTAADIPNLDYENEENWMYEKIAARLLFYDKGDLSAIPYIVEDSPRASESGSLILVPKVHNIVHVPTSKLKYKIGSLRLPPGEDQKEEERIRQLTAEIEALHVVKNGDSSKLMDNKIPDLNEKDHAKSKPELAKIQENTSPEVENFAHNSHFKDPNVLSGWKLLLHQLRRGLFRDPSGNSGKRVSSDQGGNFDNEDHDLQEKAVGPHQSLSDVTDVDSDDPHYSRLNLTQKELYVTGLYCPRNIGRVTAEEKLRSLKTARRQHRHNQTRAESNKAQERCQTISREHTKNLPPLVRATAYRVTADKMSPSKTAQGTDLKDEDSLKEAMWHQYLIRQEKIEMNTAVKNELEKGILARMETTERPHWILPTDRETTAKGYKGAGKNSSKNKNDDISDISPTIVSSKKRQPAKKHPSNRLNTNTSHPAEEASYPVRYGPKPRFFSTRDDQADPGELSDKNVAISQAILRILTRWRECVDNGVCFEPSKDSGIGYAGMKNVFYCKDKKRNENISEQFIREKSSTAYFGHQRLKCKNNDSVQRLLTQSQISQNQNKCPHHTRNRNVNCSPHIDTPVKARPDQNNNSSNVDPPEDQSSRVHENFEVSRLSHPSITESVSAGDYVSNTTDNLTETSLSESDETAETMETDRLYTKYFDLYNGGCSCEECDGQNKLLGLMPLNDFTECMSEYPLVLGRLRKDYRFLTKKDYQPQTIASEAPTLNRFTRWDCPCVCEKLLEVFNDIMIRKEILSSSLGHTFTTVTFTKAGVFDKMKLYSTAGQFEANL